MSSSSDDLSPQPPSPDQQPTQLESLVSHLLAAKRSLSSVSHVLRANELVTSTRRTLESNVVITARTGFVRSGIDEQVNVLEHVHAGSESVGHRGHAELKDVLRTLDEAEQRLKATLQALRDTIVESGLRPEGEEKRSLMDFVDEGGVKTLLDKIQDTVGNAGTGQRSFAETNKIFAREVLEVRHLLPQRKTRIFDDNLDSGEASSPIPEILTNMEDNAKEMADNLESLVKHYDLCVSAIKHTEGGGDVAQRIAGGLPEGIDIGETDLGASPEPISDDDRQEMIAIIEKDAGQVEEVIAEIRDRIAEMEAQEQILARHVSICKEEYANTDTAFTILEEIGYRLPAFIAQSQVFLMRWEEDRSRLEENMEELEGLREFYDGFLTAYDNLLIEVGRRKTLEAKAEKVVHDAMSKINKLYDEDAHARDSFKSEQGDFLPVDLWPGMTSGPVQYVIAPVGGVSERVPEVPKAVIQQAVDRVSRRA